VETGSAAGIATTKGVPFVDALVRLSHVVHHVFAEVSRDYDLTPQQTQLLCLLTQGPVGMTELSRLMHLEKSSMTGLVDRVERRGLIARTRDSRDRRACQIELTDPGLRLAVAAHDDVRARLRTLTGDLSAADKEHLASVITQILVARSRRPRPA